MAAVSTASIAPALGSVTRLRSVGSERRLYAPDEALAFIDGLDEQATGNVLFVDAEGATVGVAFVETGRLCWVAADGMAPRLTTLLIDRSQGALSRARVEQVVRECRESRRPIGERLVALGLISSTGLRQAVLEHTLESLESLVAWGVSLRWVPRSAGGYSPQFTFSTGEVAAAFHARLDPAHAGRAAEVVARATAAEDSVAVFRAIEGELRLLHLSGPETPPTWELTELASSLLLMGQITEALDPEARVMAFVAGSGGVVTLLTNGLLYCVLVRDPRAMARALSRLSAEARANG